MASAQESESRLHTRAAAVDLDAWQLAAEDLRSHHHGLWVRVSLRARVTGRGPGWARIAGCGFGLALGLG